VTRPECKPGPPDTETDALTTQPPRPKIGYCLFHLLGATSFIQVTCIVYYIYKDFRPEYDVKLHLHFHCHW